MSVVAGLRYGHTTAASNKVKKKRLSADGPERKRKQTYAHLTLQMYIPERVREKGEGEKERKACLKTQRSSLGDMSCQRFQSVQGFL